MSYLYVSNVSPRDRFQKIELAMDNGSVVEIEKGKVYDLSASELTRASRYVVLIDSAAAAEEPTILAYLPIRGVPSDGDVPIWDSTINAFEPGAQTGGGGGGTTTVSDASTTVKGVSRLSTAPASAITPIAVGTNDPRVTADQVVGTASVRTIGTGAQQAAAGNHTHSIANVTGLQAAIDAAATDTDLSTHVADTTAIHGVTDTAGLGYILTWNGTNNYVPASLRTVTERPREFRGPTDPASIGTITLANYDTWIPTVAA